MESYSSCTSTQGSTTGPQLRRARQSSSRRARGVGGTELTGWTPEDLANLNALRQINIHPTRFANEEVMRRMGIYDQVGGLLEKMDLQILLSLDEPTYPELTRQFLATITFIEDEGQETGKLYFRIGATRYAIPFYRFCELYDFPRAHTVRVSPEFPRATLLWTNIATSERYEFLTAKMSKIRNPTIRHTMRLLGNTLFARAHPGWSTTTELGLLYEGIGHELNDHVGRAIPLIDYDICQGSTFLSHLMSIRSNLDRYGPDGIHIGGMITPLLRYAAVNFNLYEAIQDRVYMDEEYLLGIKTLTGRYNQHSLMYAFTSEEGTPQCCFLPTSRYSHTETNDGIRFRLPKQFYFKVPRPQAYNPSSW